MTQLAWDQIGERSYQSGVDRGVLYLPDGSGIPWNGLTSVDDDFSDISTTPYWYDGTKYMDQQSNADFSFTLKAFTYPDEFLQFEGSDYVNQGLIATNQKSGTFGLSYRTLIGNDINDGLGYKIHLLYNLTAVPDDQTFDTIDASPTALEFGWKVQGVPISIPGFAPTMHFIIDSTVFDPNKLMTMEEILYGTDTTDPVLPPYSAIESWLFDGGHKITITDNGDGTWTASSLGDFVRLTDPTTFVIDEVNATYSDPDTYDVSTTD